MAVGHTALDYIIQINEFPKPNSSTAINNMKTFYGGAAANVAVVSANLGLDSSLISAVGGDFVDSEYHELLKSLSIDVEHMIVVDDEKSPTAFVMTNAQNDQISYFYWGAAKYFKNSTTPVDAIKNARAVHLATGDPGFNKKCGEAANKLNKLISFDPGQDLHMYSPEELKEVIKICNILFGNHHEIDRILKILDTDVENLQKFGPEIVVKTIGMNGSNIYADEKIEIDAKCVPTVDPTGAGDSYRAGFLRAYLNGEDLEFCGRFASAVASFVVEAEGCQTNIPTYDMALKRMKE
ncbi:MAG TPA: carbohydrate kinase family protein [Methanobacterium sp.]|nr:carbohydrate kinase family protein [Methanobacterium sp.]